MTASERALESEGAHRYGIVLGVALVTVLFLIIAGDAPWSHAVSLLLSAGMLAIVIVTSRGHRVRRAWSGVALAVVTLVLVVLVALDTGPASLPSIASAALVIVTVVQLVRGLLTMLSVRGVTVQAVAGALAVYLLLGIVFANAISAMAKIGTTPYFAQGFDGSESQRVYFSFTSMTTTGYGDLSPATSGGRAVAVLEMLTGQIYLVTVISLLVGNLRRRRDGHDGGATGAT